MLFERPAFWLVLAVAFTALRLWDAPHQARRRAMALTLCGAAGLGGLLGLLLPLGLLLATAGLLAWRMRQVVPAGSLPRLSPQLRSLLWILPLLALWLVGKESTARGLDPWRLLLFVGFSYVLVKVWTLVRDFHDGRLSAPPDSCPPGFWEIAAYLLHFPTYIAGPMHQMAEFRAALAQPHALTAARLVDILYRLLLGLVKIKLLVPLLTPMSLLVFRNDNPLTVWDLIQGAVGYFFLLWADFSGYSDLAVACSRLVGVEVPENFRAPFLARNIRDFWQRWHISFSRVLTQYLFTPLTRRLQRRWPDRPNLTMALAYGGTFLICGYWHGPTVNFVLWGLYHALGLILHDLYRVRIMKLRLQRRKQGRRPELLPVAVGVPLATAATFLFVAMGWILFVLPMERLLVLTE
ncbi:MAG: MBOAT family protein [Magnetococcales bacterium]|nr:MBOAT family protein [Magnetococcales bacterium]